MCVDAKGKEAKEEEEEEERKRRRRGERDGWAESMQAGVVVEVAAASCRV